MQPGRASGGVFRRQSPASATPAAATPNPDAADARAPRSVRPLARLFPYIRRYPHLVAGAVVFLALAALTTLTLPIAVRRMIDHGFSASDAGFINTYFTMLLVIAAVLALASACRYYFVITLGERVVADIRRDVFAHVTALSAAFYDVNRSGEIVSRLTADTTQIKSTVGATASVALRNIILCAGAIVMMFITSPRLSALALAAIPLIVFPIVGFGRRVRRRSRIAQDTLADAMTLAGEAIGATRTLQAFNAEDEARRRFAGAVDAAFAAARSAIRARSILTGFAIAIAFGSVVGVLWYGAQSVLAGELTPGRLGQFLLYSLFAAGALGSLSEVWGEVSQAAGAAERLGELLDEHPAITAPADPQQMPEPARGEVEFDNVGFAYPARPDLPTLDGISFTVAPGETVAIVGASGAGKSTVFSLLLRYYDVATGSVKIDGVDLRRADPKPLRDRIALVPQDVTIFASTVAENIAIGQDGADRAAIIAAARAAQAHDFIQNLQNGYDTPLGERGITLSGGQRQRIAIARAILRDAPVLLLDEATSALDAESEKLVQVALEELMQNRTTLVIAHRLATVLKADRILVMDKGRIVEQGTHETLVARNGLYARLARLQFESGAEAIAAAK
ncbi:ABC transporter transmembrane domain-containing protein [Pseudohoeflea coraliihabitans]|uniref:ATP-binding cassette domain-containing protein n=1 Tax=Pseudohoeflea coraliihabitans TaxID=2860393 RepID=A0ABS6WPJ0_9HYPH|nr:ABC transporter transmembrane domain-containing protein [Pseudohoeflea sp. DP4N28-3]MBW3097873.1 ATP-binding cassette domain-containing protein [Pseudohoeflea sp. DP4N28-3]